LRPPTIAARTAERRLRVVFPAHVDESGVLHDEAVAWTVVEAPHWAAELGAQDSAAHRPHRSLRADRPAAEGSAGCRRSQQCGRCRLRCTCGYPASHRTANSSLHPSSLPRHRPSPPRSARQYPAHPRRWPRGPTWPPPRMIGPRGLHPEVPRYPSAAAIDAAHARSANPAQNQEALCQSGVAAASLSFRFLRAVRSVTYCCHARENSAAFRNL
jgi:conjugal transfer pilus assembly protein TraV